MNNRRLHPPVLLLCVTLLACAVPSLPGAAAPVPYVEAGRLETAVAGTVEAAMAQTRQAAPAPPEASAEPLEPTVTEAALTPVSTSLTPQDDGTILFLDDEAGFELSIPPGWLPLRLGHQEFDDAFSLPIAAEPAVQRALMEIKPLDPAVQRLFILDLQDGHLQKGIVTRAGFAWDFAGNISLEDDTALKDAAEALPASNPNLTVTSYGISSTASGIPIGVILSGIDEKNLDGVDVSIHQKQVYLNPPAGTLVITFTTEQDFKDATLPFFDAMIESIKLVSG